MLYDGVWMNQVKKSIYMTFVKNCFLNRHWFVVYKLLSCTGFFNIIYIKAPKIYFNPDGVCYGK